MNSSVVEDMNISLCKEEQSSIRHLEPDAVCHYAMNGEKKTFVPLSLDEQICLVALVESYLHEWISGDVHTLAALKAVERSMVFGVKEKSAREILSNILSYQNSPVPGFF